MNNKKEPLNESIKEQGDRLQNLINEQNNYFDSIFNNEELSDIEILEKLNIMYNSGFSKVFFVFKNIILKQEKRIKELEEKIK